MLEGSDYFLPPDLDHIFTLLEDEGRDSVVHMDGRDLDLHPLDPDPRDKAQLCVLPALALRLAQLQADHPLDRRLQVWVLGVQHYLGDVQAPDGIAGRIFSSVDSLYFFEGAVAESGLLLQRPVVARPLLGMRDIVRVCQLSALTDRIKELYRLISACCDY